MADLTDGDNVFRDGVEVGGVGVVVEVECGVPGGAFLTPTAGANALGLRERFETRSFILR